MKYKVVDQPLQGRLISNSIVSCLSGKDLTEVNFLSKKDYHQMGNIIIPEETFISSIFGNEIILYNFNKPGYYKIDIIGKGKEFLENDNVPEFGWSSGIVLNLDRKECVYKCLTENNEEVFVFEPKYPLSYKWFKYGILIFSNNEKENNWIKCLDPDGGKEKWKVDFPWQFVRLETYKNLIVLEYQAYDTIRTDKGYEGERDWYNPNRCTIVLNGETGEELWKLRFVYSRIDHEKGVVLSGNDSRVLEVEISSGKVKNNISVNLPIKLGYHPHFVDDNGIYYTTHEGSFGKINKANGTILWEFDLIDSEGEKRKLSDWLLLENGNLVLQAMPNHPNGDLTCIFNVEENLQFSKVKNGERISPQMPPRKK